MPEQSETSLPEEGAALARRCISGALQHDHGVIIAQISNEEWDILASCIMFQSFLLAGLMRGLYPNNTLEEWSDFLMEQEMESYDND